MFYNHDENRVHNILNKKYIKRKEIKCDIKNLSKLNQDDISVEIDRLKKSRNRTNKQIKKLKSILKLMFTNDLGLRTLDHNLIKERHKISVFESSLTRMLNIENDKLSTDIIVVQSYFFEILRDIVLEGFMFNGEKYVLFTASAGQIRTKKTVFIMESLLERHKNTLMCGLDIDSINNSKEQGVNINKFLAYLALNNSATENWNEFNIERSIVVDDLETEVNAFVDYIDNNTYEITRKRMNIPINHTDGCGLILPKLSKKSFMVRLPWIKGLLVPFPFDKFKDLIPKNSGLIVKDIYGIEHDILKERIEVIFTKSQFKMWKYYKSWGDYQERYKKYDCLSSKCNEEEDFFSDVKLNYQMLQTLDQMTDEELTTIGNETFNNIRNLGSNKSIMLKALGVTKSNSEKSYFQKALEIYPELLSDPFSREVIKDVKKSIVKEAKSGKLSIKGNYTFIIPDLYAFCERLFLNKETPTGLLKNGEVFCSLFQDGEELDCLRSPHLYREHAVRLNTTNDTITKWFITKGLYASIHDPISKILQYDNDGDKSLVTSDKTFVECAKRHMEGIVPLYYEMAVSEKEKITNDNLYRGLVAAYTGGNIGEISNHISKIWNSNNIDLNIVKMLCMENNFVIDYAKTLYKLERPKSKDDQIKKYTKTKLPTFFLYAKDKNEEQVEPINNSVVNRLTKLTPNSRLVFKDLGLDKIDINKLLSCQRFVYDRAIIEKYDDFNMKRRFIKISKDNLHIYSDFRNELLTIHNDINFIVDTLVNYLFIKRKSSKKEVLWQSFGDVIVENLKRNFGKYKVCINCGNEFEGKHNQSYCPICAKKRQRERDKEYQKNKYYSPSIK
ncbi:hypothetical protein BSK59_13050 [Paenibacillus odorifer]|uniref:RNA dependent RNA polymerase n=1 Tax=Paenibacillus odorifer TaxID=189426 RepID=UPI00096D7807|nr:hypothetical protein [Paenibacillus odorifer]OME55400.1 hypothetical protein BSK59_13050 [Paenibacillus odorifer]